MFSVAVVKDVGAEIMIGRGISTHDSFLSAIRSCREFTRYIAQCEGAVTTYVGTKNAERDNTWRVDCIMDAGKLVFWVTEKNEWD